VDGPHPEKISESVMLGLLHERAAQKISRTSRTGGQMDRSVIDLGEFDETLGTQELFHSTEIISH